MKMTFGKHKGQDVDSMPYDYVNWLLNNVPITNKPLRLALEARRDTATQNIIKPFDDFGGSNAYEDDDEDYEWVWDDY